MLISAPSAGRFETFRTTISTPFEEFVKDIRAYPLSAWIAVAAMVLSGCAPSDSAGPWASWRGPTGMGLSETTELPTVWSRESENIRWDAELEGFGNSSPIVVGGVVIISLAS